MESELLRDFLLQFLKTKIDAPTYSRVRDDMTFSHCVSAVVHIAKQQCPQMLDGQGCLREDDHRRLIQVVWDLILERVLIPSHAIPNALNDGWPFLSLTEHGKKVVASLGPIPYDPDGFVKALDERVSGLHSTIQVYLAEAILALRTGNHLSCAVMLGAASEWAFIELCNHVSDSFASPADKAKFDGKVKSRKMADYLKAIGDFLQQKHSQLPKAWQQDSYAATVRQVADLIREARNEAGHPREAPQRQSHDDLYAKLRLFGSQCEKIYDLKKWLIENKQMVT